MGVYLFISSEIPVGWIETPHGGTVVLEEEQLQRVGMVPWNKATPVVRQTMKDLWPNKGMKFFRVGALSRVGEEKSPRLSSTSAVFKRKQVSP